MERHDLNIQWFPIKKPHCERAAAMINFGKTTKGVIQVKRKMLIWVIAVLLCFSLPSMAGAADEPQFRMSLTAKGDEVVMVIFATSLTDLYGFELKVSYDPLRMKFINSESAFPGFSVPPAGATKV